MNSKLFVGNLPFSANEESLTQLFSKFGKVESATVITDQTTGRSKGFGFVELSSQEEAERAIAELNGKDFEGRALRVDKAIPKESRGGDRRPRSDRRGGFGGGRSGGRGRDEY